MKEFDVIVLGSGSGLDVASAYARRGHEVAVVEPGRLGGTCLNRGCIPSKMLIHHADIINTVEDSGRFHIDAEVNNIQFQEIIKEVNETVKEDSDSIERGLKSSEQHTLYQSEARFVEDRVIEVDGEKITAETIIIAAGSRPMIPPIEGIEDVDYLTSKEALKLEEKPDEMVIVGGGYISVELAHFFDAMGVEVTILEMGDSLVGREDREISQKFTELAKEEYQIELGVMASELRQEGDRKTVVASRDDEELEFEADEVLVATGRVPNTDRLELKENTGIDTDDRSFVETDEYLETSVEGVYALGDIAGNFMFKHSANLEAEHVFRNTLAGNRYPVDFTAMPHAIFSHPQIAGVGKTEQELEEAEEEYVSATYDYSDTGMGLALKEEDGFVKVLASEDGNILGCHIIGPEASTLIHEVLVSMRAGKGKVSDIQDTVHIHPALSEVVQRAFSQVR